MSKRRVVVTGLGIVSPVGNDLATAWGNITAGVLILVLYFGWMLFAGLIAALTVGVACLCFFPTMTVPARRVTTLRCTTATAR